MRTLEQPIDTFVEQPERSAGITKNAELCTTYTEITVVFPTIITQVGDAFSDSELLVAAEMAGTFKFWDGPEEDIYNELRQK